MKTHDYNTITLWAQQLDSTCVLVGESGGLSAVYEVTEAEPMALPCSVVRPQDNLGYIGTVDGIEMVSVRAVKIVTEHGIMYVPGITPFKTLWH